MLGVRLSKHIIKGTNMSRTRDIIDIEQQLHHPLDQVEHLLDAHNWVFERMTTDEIAVQVQGQYCTYNIFFIWQAEFNALQFCCQYDLDIPQIRISEAAAALMHLNENAWIGHYDLPSITMKPTFRHTCLLRGIEDMSDAAFLEDMIETSLLQCEKNYAAFYVLSQEDKTDNIDLALMHIEGQA
jgi:hypothetical protein